MVKSDLTRPDRIKDSDIDYSDIPPLGDEVFKKATVAWLPAKQQLTIPHAELAQSPRQRLPDMHKSYSAGRNEEPAAAPVAFHNNAEE
jgi:hypothetical protein